MSTHDSPIPADESYYEIDVTEHARLRFLQRVDPASERPAHDLRRLFRKGREVDDDQVSARVRCSEGWIFPHHPQGRSTRVLSVIRQSRDYGEEGVGQ